MPESVDPEVSEPTQDGREAVGCGRIVLFSLSVVWIALGTVLLQLPNWVMEQLVFEGSFGLPNVRVFIAAGYGISLLLPFGLLTILVKDSKLNNYFRLWLVPSIFVLMISPARIFKITAFHTASLIQIGGMILFLASAGIWWRSRQMKNAAEVKLKGGGRGVGLAVLTGGMLIFPWLIWGALGSVMDLLISFTVSLLFGLCFSLIFSLSIYPEIHNKAGSYRVRNHLVDGLAVSLALVIMTAGLSQSGNQGLLMLSVPILGWVVVALSRFGKEREPGVNWQAVGLAPAIAILWGLIWFDPDELMFVIGSGQGEIMGLANRAMLLSLGIGVVISIAALFFAKIP